MKSTIWRKITVLWNYADQKGNDFVKGIFVTVSIVWRAFSICNSNDTSLYSEAHSAHAHLICIFCAHDGWRNFLFIFSVVEELERARKDVQKLDSQLIIAVNQKIKLSEQLEQWQVSWNYLCLRLIIP